MFRKSRLVIILLIFLFSGFIFFIGKTYADEILPTISTACESKSGLLFAYDDGFSIFKKCNGNSRRVVLIGEKGEKGPKGDPGEKGDKGDTGEKGDKGEPGAAGFAPEKIIHVCFDVATSNLFVMKNGSCFPHVHWKIAVQCVDNEACVPDNLQDSFYVPPQLAP